MSETRAAQRMGRGAVQVMAAVLVVLSSGCSGPSSPSPTPSGSSAGPTTTAAVDKVMIIVEENKTYADVLESGEAPYLTGLASTYGSATAMSADYPVACPSLAAYIILTSGTDHGICDDADPAAHPLPGDSIFQQVTRAGLSWRGYAESMPGPCALGNEGRYLVRHVPATYYVENRADCGSRQLPLGTLTSGLLHDDVAAGALPAYSFVTPNACSDMHGAVTCPFDQVAKGDAWLAGWMPSIMAGPDFRSGRLAVIVTWDEGSKTSNHIPTLVLSTHTHAVRSEAAWTQCSILRTVEDLLHLPPLGCAATAPPMSPTFALTP